MVKKPGEIIFNQGDSGKEFYIIHTGLLEVSIGGRKVRSLGMGDYVGGRLSFMWSIPTKDGSKSIRTHLYLIYSMLNVMQFFVYKWSV